MSNVIVIGFYAGPGTSTTETSLADKLTILRRCFESCAADGPDVAIIATGTQEGVEQVRKTIPGIPLYGVWNTEGLQRGECAIGLRIIKEYSNRDWIFKVAGDTFHPMPGWTERLAELGRAHEASLVATAHSRPDWVETQAWAARPAFLKATWPPMDADWNRIGLEAQWGERIAKAGLGKQWYQVPSDLFCADGTSNWIPKDLVLRYFHAHTLKSAEGWKLIDFSVKPDLKIKISMVVPARNENQLNPFRNNKSLLADTFDSFAESSQGAPIPEAILVDDGSDVPLPNPAAYPGVYRVIKNPEPLGVDPSRNIGIWASHGDVIGLVDGHSRIGKNDGTPCPMGLQKAATVAMEKQALVVGRCMHLEMPKMDDRGELCGAVWVPLTDPKQNMGLTWESKHPPTGLRRCNAVLGASYFAPRDLWERMGGFVNDCRCWGYSEEGISLKAALLGIPIWYCGDLQVAHWFRPNGPSPYTVDGWHKYLNRAKVLFVTFEEQTFKNFWLPRLKAYQWGDNWQAGISSHSILCEAQRFRVRKTVSDAQVIKDLFKVTL